MTTGKTGEQIIITGEYHCQEHHDYKYVLLKDNVFPQCGKGVLHDAVWVLKEVEKNTDATNGHGTTGKEKKEEAESLEEEIKTLYPNSGIDIDLYKRKGFYAAQASKNGASNGTFSLGSIIKAEQDKTEEEIKDFKGKFKIRIDIVKQEFDYIRRLIAEKEVLKEEFAGELDIMQQEIDRLKQEIKEHYSDLRDEIKSFGTAKEKMIEKRLGDLDAEIKKVTTTYHDLENKQNEKHRKNFEDYKLKDTDKQFYYDYREQLKERLAETEKRVKILDREGLNFIIARFLIGIGWIAAFVSSWFFMQWRTPSATTGSGTSITTNLAVYVLDSLRNFVNHYGWLIALITFVFYILIILFVANRCYRWGINNGFIASPDEKNRRSKNNLDDEDIELNRKDELRLRAQFRAGSWYELGIKIIPAITGLLLFFIILSLGSSVNTNLSGTNIRTNSFSELNDSLSSQLTGLLLPIAVTAVIFLYITKFIETRALRAESENNGGVKKDKRMGWEIVLAILIFLFLVVLLLTGPYLGHVIESPQIGAIGFLTGTLCTGFALGYGYRYISLYETHAILVNKIVDVSDYIERWFYPFEANYNRSRFVWHKLHRIYLQALELIDARNDLAIKISSPGYEKENDKRKENPDGKTGNKASNEARQQAEDGQIAETKNNIFDRFKKALNDLLKAKDAAHREQLQKEKDKVKKLEQELKNLKSDVLVVDDQVYFPEAAARVREIKLLIDDKARKTDRLKDEIDGYYKNNYTWASLTQQLDGLYRRQEEAAEKIQVLEKGAMDIEMELREQLAYKIACIMEGYQLGSWFTGQ